MKTARLLLVVCSLVACGHLATAADSQFAERITVTEVEIPVRVLIDGQPVRGLTAEHFELFDRGVPQQILSCEERDLSLRLPPPESPPAEYRPDPESSDGRKLLVVFDSTFSQPALSGACTAGRAGNGGFSDPPDRSGGDRRLQRRLGVESDRRLHRRPGADRPGLGRCRSDFELRSEGAPRRLMRPSSS